MSMTFEDLRNILEIVTRELDISIELLDKENFDQLNIIGNRIMENCLFSEDYRLYLPGLFVKEIALSYNKIFSSREAKAFHSAKIIGKDYLKNLLKNIKSELNEELIWTEYHLFTVKILQYLRDDYENNLYTDNIEFSKSVIWNLMKFLQKNEEYLYLKYNQLFGGIINILDRVFRVHSGTLGITMIKLYFKMLDRLYDYLILKYFDKEDIDKDKLKEEIEPYIAYLYKIENLDRINISEFNRNLWEIIKLWRIYYIRYRDSISTIYKQPSSRRVIQLPEETKKVIEESLKKSIEKKI